MNEDILIQIGNKIKDARTAKQGTMQELATRAKVSKGLISQIENNRTIPSLPVLLSIIRALNLDLNEFFKDILLQPKAPKVMVKRSSDYQQLKKENTKGFTYKRIMVKEIKNLPVDIVLLELKKGARRKTTVRTEAYEFKYMIRGSVEYIVAGKKHILNEGDSLFFDGRNEHTLANIGKTQAQILVVYFFISDTAG